MGCSNTQHALQITNHSDNNRKDLQNKDNQLTYDYLQLSCELTSLSEKHSLLLQKDKNTSTALRNSINQTENIRSETQKLQGKIECEEQERVRIETLREAYKQNAREIRELEDSAQTMTAELQTILDYLSNK